MSANLNIKDYLYLAYQDDTLPRKVEIPLNVLRDAAAELDQMKVVVQAARNVEGLPFSVKSLGHDGFMLIDKDSNVVARFYDASIYEIVSVLNQAAALQALDERKE